MALAASAVTASEFPQGVGVGDLDGDGYDDLYDGSRARLGGATELRVHAANLGARVEPLGDFDGDGFDDLVVTDASTNAASLVRGSATGPAVATAVPFAP